jgi:hypothetical protein
MLVSIRDLLSGSAVVRPPASAPSNPSPRYAYLLGASFANGGTNTQIIGPILSQWLCMIWGYRGDIVALDGDAGDDTFKFLTRLNASIADDELNLCMDQMMDCAILECVGAALIESVHHETYTIDNAVEIVGKLLTRAKKVYTIRYPNLEGSAGTTLMYDLAPGLNIPEWDAWRDTYDAACAAAGATVVDVYYDWKSSLVPIPYPPGALDFHISSASSYAAAVRLDALMQDDFD